MSFSGDNPAKTSSVVHTAIFMEPAFPLISVPSLAICRDIIQTAALVTQ